MAAGNSMTGDLSVTALYTSQAWVWGGLPQAELFDTRDARRVFEVTNFFYDLARKFRRGVPSMRHSLVHRHTMIDHLLAKSGATQVLELAAGLSRRGATVSADPGIRYTEVDLPNVIATKRSLLASSDSGRAIARRPNWSLVGADVTELDLATVVEPGEPALVIAEGLFMYLDAAAQRELCARIAAALASCPRVTLVFDLLRHEEEPDPGPVMRAIMAGMTRFTGGQGFERDARSRAEVVADIRAVGFDDVAIHEAADVAGEWGLPFADHPTRVVLFRCELDNSAAGGGAAGK